MTNQVLCSISTALCVVIFGLPSLNGQIDQSISPALSAEDVFARYANRVLFVACKVSPVEVSQGSGVLISRDGFAATNAHVLDGCAGVTVLYNDHGNWRPMEAVVRYSDKASDVAILRLAGQDFDSFDITSRPIRPGERAYAIGNPEGFEQTITEGIVSGMRQVGGVSLIQHSASTSHGSSGGALVSARGELLGITSSTIAAGDAQNLNFAVPMNVVKSSLDIARSEPSFSTPTPTVPSGITQAPNPLPRVPDDAIHLSLGIVVDNSSNMRDSLAAARYAALSLVGRLQTGDKAFVVNFNTLPYLDCDFTDQSSALAGCLGRSVATGGSAIRDAVRVSIDHLHDKGTGARRALVVFSSGHDSASAVSIGSLINLAKVNGVPIFVVAFPSAQGDDRDLDALAKQSGGRSSYPKSLSAIEAFAASIVAQLRSGSAQSR